MAGVTCLRCGYTLDGLSPDARCPECNLPVEESLRGRRLINAAPEYRRTLGLGLLLVSLGCAARAVAELVMIFSPLALTGKASSLGLVLMLVRALLDIPILAGAWLITSRDPGVREHEIGSARRPARLYLGFLSVALIFTTGAAVFAPAGSLSSFGITPARFGFGGGPLGAGLIWVVGILLWMIFRLIAIVLLSQYLAQLALKIPDHSLHKFASTCAWLTPTIYVVGSFCCGLGPIIAHALFSILAGRFRFHASGVFSRFEPDQPAPPHTP